MKCDMQSNKLSSHSQWFLPFTLVLTPAMPMGLSRGKHMCKRNCRILPTSCTTSIHLWRSKSSAHSCCYYQRCLCAERKIRENEEPHWPRCSGC